MGKNTRTWQPGRAILAAFGIALFMKFFLFDFMIAEGRSMVPAISPGSILLVNRVAYGFRFPWDQGYSLRWNHPKEGDIVVFITPLGQTAVKRCAGLPEGDVFIALGDNRDESYDSRAYGSVPVDRILGKVVGKK
ncbi:signal peptidase I [Breznakiella homolactica]|uniref:Signal peptidase I n=1 Tax=Breznakiella homolactica TaxID=2798577 RepID=A0A7T7XLB5_9SPIR|nr:signal peptidase I [Breznakiella homolactica]QQO08323.1 signal peptidase I [Breznakiella homolactica]